ncbi:MAG: hypothetical protein IJB97_04135, partial [Clostridia bacterium]|nr:hypothetical protein [Clostridia bacterium]
QFYWQSRRVFNHIAPMVDSRVAKLEKLKPKLTVRAFSDEDGDVKAAQLATGILTFVQDRIGFEEVVSKGVLWSETCGSAFYKVLWDENGGRKIAEDENGAPIYEGEVCVSVVPLFEIYPDDLCAEDLADVKSLIHAKIVSVDYVAEKYGVDAQGQAMSELSVTQYSEPSAAKNPVQLGVSATEQRDRVILIERYTRPTAEEKDGRLEIVAGGKLLYYGPLPYKSENRGERGLPFVKQDCLRLPGAFFGSSVVDRLIPVQRAYNAVRNRKHEFLNRLATGVLTVEDGSVDVEELAEEGLLPGKILVYRQGGKAPEMLDSGKIPTEFKDEEEWLEREFEMISGVSELSQNSTPARVTSATGLQLLLSQDDARLSATVGSMERAVKETARLILRLYRQFAGSARLMTLTGENKKTQVYYFNSADIAANDILFETGEALTPTEKKETLLKLYEAGVLTDEDGKLSQENKNRILEAFGFGSYENAKDISALHSAKASEENLALLAADLETDSYDDHALHVVEHTRFLLSAEFKKIAGGSVGALSEKGKAIKQRFAAHIRCHEEQAKEKEKNSPNGRLEGTEKFSKPQA